MSEENKIAESGIKQDQNNGSEPMTNPAEIQYLDRSATPWVIDTCFKMLHVCAHMAEKDGVTDLNKVAEEFNEGSPNPIPVERMSDFVKMARTMVKYPMPMSISKQAFALVNIYATANLAYDPDGAVAESDDVEKLKEKLNDICQIIDEMFPEQEPEETPPEAIEAFKKEMEKQGLNVEPVQGSVVKVQKKDGE